MFKKHGLNSEFIRGYKVKIYPTEEQKKDIMKNINVSRAVYNIGLDIQNNSYLDSKKTLSIFTMIEKFRDLRNNNPNYYWLKDVTFGVINGALNNLDTAFNRYFSKQNRHPKFKSKRYAKKSFCTRAGRTHIKGKYISISGLKDMMVLAKDHHIPQDRKLYNPVVSFDGRNYWFSCIMEINPIDMDDIPQSDPIGVDVGIVNLLVSSDMKSKDEFEHFPDTSKLRKRIKRQQRILQKHYDKYCSISQSTKTKYEDVPKSKNYLKKIQRLEETYERIHNKNFNAIHNATKKLVMKNPSAIVIETISINEQLKQGYMREFAPAMMYCEIHRQIKYKAHNRGIPVIMADRSYPSSQLCSNCGERGYFKQGRIFKCSHCGYSNDRDLNAALNLSKLAY